jgi:hypothetical protein
VNEPTESIPAADPERLGGSGEPESRARLWRHKSQATMRTMAVVMIDVGVQDALELVTAGDQDPVEALAPNGADEALGKRVGLRSLDRCSDDLDPLAAEDLVEGPGELRVAIVDQEAWRRGSVGERPRELAGLLRDPGVAWMVGAARYVHPAATKLDEEQDVEPCREDGVDVKKSHASMLAAWPRMNSRQETPALWPAGPSPASRRGLRIVVVATLNPSAPSSPAIRW